ncbi:uncharacterized protein BO88DRAFT_455392 [Aspergillus vadensis CBS 113365]|uniref:Uncharacterized protein n=1 Tax=Aspergillus vadensis (strain CBS 113365 / IMI 142717 / IBT 24658) TaxID=1448311 RepID=A0A319BNR9_ASPVC|nr:hypothetical protein BO88DRAFT_455392 [Aspergillus vadensis CBS 113365]PYH67373.1 hypothetical protein BO88DRAFT_455392 [Aspergillus vadensis CBS 113365]
MRRLQKKKTSSSRTAAVQVSSDESLLTLGGWRAPYLLPGSMTAEKDHVLCHIGAPLRIPPARKSPMRYQRTGTSNNNNE